MKKQTTAITMNAVVMVLMALAIGGVVMGVSHTANQLSVEIKENNVEAVLASAHVGNSTVMSVPVLYYDQKADECVDLYNISLQHALERRQFEWTSCGYYNLGIEAGLVESALDEQYLPVAVGGKLLSNRGMAKGFQRWFNSVEGVNKSYTGILNLVYDAEKGSFEYSSDEFYPLDEINVAGDESVNDDGHNHLFTMNMGIPFQVLANGKETFVITADDDTWVFVDDTLVLDMGGVHEATTGQLKISDEGEVYAAVEDEDFAYAGVKLNAGDGAIIRVFHADRNSSESVLKLSFVNAMPNITNTTLAKTGSVEVAYDPANLSYVAPLGESMTVRPDRTKPLTLAIAVQVMTIGGLAVLFVIIISVAWRYLRRDHNWEE